MIFRNIFNTPQDTNPIQNDFYSSIFQSFDLPQEIIRDPGIVAKLKPVPELSDNIIIPTIISQPIKQPTQAPNIINNYVSQYDALPLSNQVVNLNERLNSFVTTFTNTVANNNIRLESLQNQILSQTKTNHQSEQILDIIGKVNEEIKIIKNAYPTTKTITSNYNGNLDELTKQSEIFNSRIADQQAKLNELARNYEEIKNKDTNIIKELQSQLSLTKQEFKKLQVDVKPIQQNIYPSYNEVSTSYVNKKSCVVC